MNLMGLFSNSGRKLKAEIQRLAKNQITLEPQAPGRKPAPDASKIGGRPFLPAGAHWPEFADTQEDVTRPLSFFCQLNLAELAPFDTEGLLPKAGLLLFFYDCGAFRWGFDPEDAGAAQVLYFEDTTGFVPFDIPEGLDAGYVMPELALTFRCAPSYPNYEEFDIHSSLDCDWEDYDKILEKLGADPDQDPEDHKVLGYADIIQGEMLTECERTARGLYCGDPESYQNTPEDESADILEWAGDWTLLLQLGTIAADGFEWMFGDCGLLYYYIRKEDLAARRFDRIWFSLQCG